MFNVSETLPEKTGSLGAQGKSLRQQAFGVTCLGNRITIVATIIKVKYGLALRHDVAPLTTCRVYISKKPALTANDPQDHFAVIDVPNNSPALEN